MKPLLVFAFSLFGLSAAAQPNRYAAVDIAPSLNGSGDLPGPFLNIEYGKYRSKRVAWSVNLGATVHSASDPLLLVNGVADDRYSLREVTAGLQAGLQFWVAPVRSRRHELRVGIGPVLRYQSASNNGGRSVVVVRVPDPVPAVVFNHREPQHLFSPGYQFGLAYAYTFRKGFLLGLKAGLQNDTNADIITHVGLRVGKRF